MRNVDQWKPRIPLDAKGNVVGTHMERITWAAYKKPIQKYSKGRIADVGCGDVPYWPLYRDHTDEQICIDWPNTSFEKSHLDVQADLNEPIPNVESNSFDTVLCTDVLEHMYNPRTLFSELCRILRPDGHLILAVPYMYWIHDTYDYHRYTRQMLEKLCEENEMTIVSLEAYGGLPEILFDLVAKGYSFYNFPMRSLFYRCWFLFGKLISKLGPVKRMSTRSRVIFPLGYVLVATKRR